MTHTFEYHIPAGTTNGTEIQPTLTDRAAALVSRLQPFPTADQMIDALHAPQLVALPPVVTDDQLRQMAQHSLLRIRETPTHQIATDEEIAESAATMTPDEAAHVATLPSSFDEDSQPQDGEIFGEVSWTNGDIQDKAQELLGRQLSGEEVEMVRGAHSVRHIDDRMIEAGWTAIEDAINNL